MSRLALFLRQWPLAVSYGLVAFAAVHFTRFDGGIAFLWGATALLIATLVRTSVRHWWAPLLACGLVNVPLTALFGLGWLAAVPMSVLNVGEAVLAAYWLKRRPGSGELMASLSWFGRFLFAMIAAPALIAPLASVMVWATGGHPGATLLRFLTGHSLGNLTLTPIAYMLTGRAALSETRAVLRRRRREALTLLPLIACICIWTFWQANWPLLFLPVIWVVFATFRLGRFGAAAALAILAIVGGVLTSLGHGPVMLSGAGLGDRIQFLQFYLAATVLTVLPIAADLHSRRKLHRQLMRSEAEFRLLADHSTDVIMRISLDGVIRYASPSIRAASGYAPDELVGQHSRLLIDERDLERVVVEHRATLSAAGEGRTYEYRGRTRSGEVRWFSTHARALLDDDGEPVELLAIVRDITGVKASEEELTRAALTDVLTGLPNRRAFEALVMQRSQQAPVGADCIALLDLDRFKGINDTYGHDTGDAVLVQFADLARKMVRSKDTVARLGGEEFVILFENTAIEQAYQICDRLRRLLALSPLNTPGGVLRLTVSGGVAALTGGLDEALKSADTALYRAKRGGRDQLLLAA